MYYNLKTATLMQGIEVNEHYGNELAKRIKDFENEKGCECVSVDKETIHFSKNGFQVVS